MRVKTDLARQVATDRDTLAGIVGEVDDILGGSGQPGSTFTVVERVRDLVRQTEFVGVSCEGHFAGAASAQPPRRYHAYLYTHGMAAGTVHNASQECGTLVEGLRWAAARLLEAALELERRDRVAS